MIVKHFNRYKWELPDEWENVDHKYGAPDPDEAVELNERQIADNAVISDDEEDEDVGVRVAPTQRRARNDQRTSGRKRRHSDIEIDDLSPEKSHTQRRKR
jgi:hypothetical protein